MEFVSLLDLTDDNADGVTDSAHVGSPAGGQQLGASASHGREMAHRGGFETRKDGSGNGGGENDDDDEWASVQRELRLLRKGGVSLVRECKLAAVVGVEAAAREEAARAAARLRRFTGSEGTALLREVTE